MSGMSAGRPTSRFNVGDRVKAEVFGDVIEGVVEVVDWRGHEREAFYGCWYSYDVCCQLYERTGEPMLFKHIPESSVTSAATSAATDFMDEYADVFEELGGRDRGDEGAGRRGRGSDCPR